MNKKRTGKRMILVLQILVVLLIVTGCQQTDVENVQSQIEDTVQDKKDEMIAGVQNQAKKTLISQMETFFADPELSARLGISEEKKEELLQKLEETVQNYDVEASGIEGFQDQINDVLEQELVPQQGQEQTQDSSHEESTTDNLKEELQNVFSQFLGKSTGEK